jgi:hypothetical protein
LVGALGGFGDAPAASSQTASAPTFGDPFWAFWGDGKGELAGYDLTFPRYGQLRQGVAVTIFVTETFSNSLRVKSDPGRHPKSDEFPVMKLNLVRDFPTGIYDYNLMTSAFVALEPVNGRPAGSATKVSFSSQEWCGLVYEQLLLDNASARFVSHSYFDGEADEQRTIEVPNDALSLDCLPLWARGFAGPVLGPGESRTTRVVGSLITSRLAHRPLALGEVTLARAKDREMRLVKAGRFETERFTAAITGGPTWTFWVENAAPHRLVEWMSSDGEHAQLLASDRLKYWELHDLGGEKYLARLGLTPRAPRMP